MSEAVNFTSVLYNELKRNTALWKYLNKDQVQVVVYEDMWATEYNSVYSDHMNDNVYSQLKWVMEHVYGKKSISSTWYVAPDKYTKQQLMKGV